MKYKSRFSSLILCAFMLLSTACSKNVGNEISSGDTPVSEETTQSAEEKYLDFEPCAETTVFPVLTTVHAEYEFGVEEQQGDVVNDAVFERNLAVEELLNIKFKFIVKPGQWADKDSFNKLVSDSVASGDNEYDLVNGVMVCVMPTALNGIYHNVNDIKYLDFSQPWWVAGMETQIAINGKMYAFTGDADLSLYKDMTVMYFNMALLDDYKLDSPYTLVQNNQWTFDKMTEMALQVSTDLNGDTIIDSTNDIIGYAAALTPNRAIQAAMDLTLIGIGDDGLPTYFGVSEKMADAYKKAYEFFVRNNNTAVFNTTTEPINLFKEGRTLFLTDFLSRTEDFRDMEDDYGIVPLPKYNSEQERYHTRIGTSTSMFFVPITVEDTDLVGKVCESLAYYSYKNVVPEWYDVALKGKYTRDESTKKMIDLIRENAEIKFDCIYGANFSPSPYAFMSFWEDNVTIGESVVSWAESNKSMWQGQLDALIGAMQ